jgi:hypothetical protein
LGSTGGPFPLEITISDKGTTNGSADDKQITETITITVLAHLDYDTPGMFDPQTCTFYLRNVNSTGNADIAFGFGDPSVHYIPLVGDWDGDGQDGVGLYDPATATWHLRNSLSTGNADITFAYGVPDRTTPGWKSWMPLVGDWDGNGLDTIGLVDPATDFWYLRNSLSTGDADITFGYGDPGAVWTPLVGDWNGDGKDTIGFFDPAASVFLLRNSLDTGSADIAFGYGAPGAGWKPLVGDWAWPASGSGLAVVADKIDCVGLYDPASSYVYLRNSLTTGPADLTFGYGATARGWVALAGRWPDAPPPSTAQAYDNATAVAVDEWVTELGQALASSASDDRAAQLADAVFTDYP